MLIFMFSVLKNMAYDGLLDCSYLWVAGSLLKFCMPCVEGLQLAIVRLNAFGCAQDGKPAGTVSG